MLTSLPITVFVGALLGFLAALGIGGGTLLVLWLTQILGMDPGISKSINLLFFIAAAGSASIIRLRNKVIPWRSILPAIVTGCITAAVFSLIGNRMDTVITRKIFGGLLLITGLKELFYRDKKAR